VHIKLGAVVHAKSYHFTLSPSNLLLLPFTAHCTAPTPCSMARETAHNLPITDEPITNDTKSDSRTESDSRAMLTSSNAAAAKIADKTVPSMSDYWKKSTIIEANHKA
jgi:hypothetical protein